ncbi:MAG: alanine--glyoxylate aminotransferase family protein [Myxococcota bacterium]
MPSLLPDVDPDGLLEFSVVFTDRALNHMSARFQQVMCDLDAMLRTVYHAHATALIPGGGSYAMEAVARQLATNRRCLIIRNGWFSFRWTQILEVGGISADTTVLHARPTHDGPRAPFAPPPINTVVDAIATHRPAVVFAPHVETSAGMLLPDDYLRAVAAAVHAVGGLFVLDGVASGGLFVNMAQVGVDVLISAPQKSWSAPPSCGLVMLSEAGRRAVEQTTSTSFANDLGRWMQIMDAYLAGGHAYHATMPTDALVRLRDAMQQTQRFGFNRCSAAQRDLGARIRAQLVAAGFESVAEAGFQSPSVVVSYTDDPSIKNGRRFAQAGVQVAGGVPLRCGERDDFATFRVGLFGLDKLQDVDGTARRFADALKRLREPST